MPHRGDLTSPGPLEKPAYLTLRNASGRRISESSFATKTFRRFEGAPMTTDCGIARSALRGLLVLDGLQQPQPTVSSQLRRTALPFEFSHAPQELSVLMFLLFLRQAVIDLDAHVGDGVQGVQDVVHRNAGPGIDAGFADCLEIGEANLAVNHRHVEN